MIRVMFRLFAENWHGKYQNHIRKAEQRTLVSFFLSSWFFNTLSIKICKVRKIPQCACSHIVSVKPWAQRRQGQNFRFAVPFFRFCLSTRLTRDVFITFNKATFIRHRTNFRPVENSCAYHLCSAHTKPPLPTSSRSKFRVNRAKILNGPVSTKCPVNFFRPSKISSGAVGVNMAWVSTSKASLFTLIPTGTPRLPRSSWTPGELFWFFR